MSSPPVLYAVCRDQDDLRHRIDRRVEHMFADGLIEETRLLLHQGLNSRSTAMQAIGYRQVTDYLQGRLGLSQAIGVVKHRTYRLARRQMTWFRRQMPRLQWWILNVEDPPEVSATRLAVCYRQAREQDATNRRK